MTKKKKNKRKNIAASNPQPPPKRTKIVKQPHRICYGDLPPNHKKKFYIYDDCGTLKKYVELLCWLRSMGCFFGTVFDGIQNLNFPLDKGYPLLEVEVITPEDNSAKFLIYKNDLYMIAFLCHNKWFQFKDGDFDVEGFITLEEYAGDYRSDPWNSVGPGVMINAVNRLATQQLEGAGNTKPFNEAWEVMVFHLCEAGRLYAVESLVCKSLVPPENAGICVKRTYEDEESKILSMGDGRTIDYKDDICRLVEADRCVDFQTQIAPPAYFKTLVKSYSDLSKVWCFSSLTRGNVFPISDTLIRECHVRSRKSLRCILAAVCNINLEKVVRDGRKKVVAEEITEVIFREMEDKVRQLLENRQVRIPDGKGKKS